MDGFPSLPFLYTRFFFLAIVNLIKINLLASSSTNTIIMHLKQKYFSIVKINILASSSTNEIVMHLKQKIL